MTDPYTREEMDEWEHRNKAFRCNFGYSLNIETERAIATAREAMAERDKLEKASRHWQREVNEYRAGYPKQRDRAEQLEAECERLRAELEQANRALRVWQNLRPGKPHG